MKVSFFIAAIIIILQPLHAQKDFKFGKVSKEDFETTAAEANDPAIYLNKYSDVTFEYDGEDGWYLVYTIKERLKILNKSGLDYATKKIYLYKNDTEKETYKQLDALTHNLDGNKIEETKLSKNTIFESNFLDNYDEITWTMPSAKVGSIVEWEYKKYSPFYYSLDDLILQEKIPVAKFEAEVKIPYFFEYSMVKRGAFNITPEQTIRTRYLSFSEDVNNGYNISKTGRSNGYTASFSEVTYTFIQENIAGLKTEPFVNNVNNYKKQISFELRSYQEPNGKKILYSQNWEDVAKNLYKSEKFGKQLERSEYLENEVKKIAILNLSQEERLIKAFNVIKNLMTWNGKNGLYSSDDLSTLFEAKVGTSADINLMLISLLKGLNLDAHPVLLSTKEHGVPAFVTLEGYNYVIAYAKINGDIYLMDASDKLSVPNVLPSRTQNFKGRLVRNNGFSQELNLEDPKAAQSLELLNFSLSDDGAIKGQYKKRFSKIASLEYRTKYKSPNAKTRLNEISSQYALEDVSNLTTENFTELDDVIIEAYDFSLENSMDVVGDKLYLAPLLYLKTLENPFKAESRQYPVDFDYPFTHNQTVNINIPETFTVVSAPDPISMKLPNDLGAYNYQVFLNKGQIVVRTKLKYNNAQIDIDFYQALQLFVKQRIEKESESIVLQINN